MILKSQVTVPLMNRPNTSKGLKSDNEGTLVPLLNSTKNRNLPTWLVNVDRSLRRWYTIVKLFANAKLVKKYRIDVDDGRAHAICLDLEEESGGTDMGPSALELALMSFAGCYSAIFMLTANKMRATVESLEVNAEAVKSEQAGTITEARLSISTKTSLTEDRLHRLHDLTVKGCPVGKLFEKAGVKITYNLKAEKT